MRFKNIFRIICLVSLIVLVIDQNIFAQQYRKVKVILKNGATFQGKNGVLDGVSFSLTSSIGQQKTYQLQDISLISAKKGGAGMWAAGFGGGCAAICLVSVAAADPDTTDATSGQLLVGSLLWGGIFAGVGYVVGLLVDPWKTVYIGRSPSSFLNQFRLGMGIDPKGRVTLGLSYKF